MEIKGAEVFSVGKWNGMPFTDADLDAIVKSFEDLALSGRVPLKFGHNGDQPVTDGQPALGWVQRVWKEGGKLFADFADVPTVVYEALRKKLYKYVSVELLQDAEQNGSSYPWVLGAVALLGADRPAVSNLQELSRLAMSCRAALQFSRAGTINLIGDRSMSDEKLLDELATMKAKLATFTAENETLKAEKSKLIDDGKKEKAATIKAQVEQKFESAITAKKLLPSARERFFKWTFPKDVDSVLDFSIADADSYIKENEVAAPTGPGPGGSRSGSDDDDSAKTPDIRVSQRVRLFMSENKGVSYKDAMVAVLSEDRQLADEYRFMPDRK